MTTVQILFALLCAFGVGGILLSRSPKGTGEDAMSAIPGIILCVIGGGACLMGLIGGLPQGWGH
jgi:hypothetical protein